ARVASAGALARAQEAVASGGRTSGFAQYALGSALLASGDAEGAQRALREAQTLSPALLGARVRLAELEARSGAIVSARERLQRVIVLDPEYASAWRALYLLPPEGVSTPDARSGPGKRWAGARARLEAGAEPEAQRADLRPGQPGDCRARRETAGERRPTGS